MSGCSNCFNGCGDIISDKCVKYTGTNMDLNMIEGQVETGDSLLMVLQTFFDWMSEFNNGDGVIPNLDYGAMCPYLSDQIPNGNDSTLNVVLQAIADSICDIELRERNLEQAMDLLEANYNIACLDIVSPSSGTHDILQAVIDKLCQIELDLTALTLELHTNYVQISDIDTYIQDFIDNSPTTTLINSKMVPYIAYPYFGPTLGNFDITGAGIGDWVKVYLCNGIHNTPDLRGRVIVGATTMGSNPFSPAVDPGVAGNPTYTLNTAFGANNVALNINQMPSHTHAASIVINDPGHQHNVAIRNRDTIDGGSGTDGYIVLFESNETIARTAVTGLIGTGLPGENVFVSNAVTGSNQAHPNVQPVLAGNFIMYIP